MTLQNAMVTGIENNNEEVVTVNINKMKKVELIAMVEELQAKLQEKKDRVSEMGFENLKLRKEVGMYAAELREITVLGNEMADYIIASSKKKATQTQQSTTPAQRTGTVQTANNVRASQPAPVVQYTDENWAVSTMYKFKGKKSGSVNVPFIKETCPICGGSVRIDEANYSHRKFLANQPVCQRCQKGIIKHSLLGQVKTMVAAGKPMTEVRTFVVETVTLKAQAQVRSTPTQAPVQPVQPVVQAPVTPTPTPVSLLATGTDGAINLHAGVAGDEEVF